MHGENQFLIRHIGFEDYFKKKCQKSEIYPLTGGQGLDLEKKMH